MKLKECLRITFGVVLLVSFLCIPFLTQVQTYLSIPNEVTTFEKQGPVALPTFATSSTHVTSDTESILSHPAFSNEFVPNKAGNSSVIYEMAGLPVKKVNVKVLKDLRIVPGGQSIGVKLHTLGVLVVGHHLIKTDLGKVSPGEEASIKIGDIILKINDKEIKSMRDVAPFVEDAGKENKALNITVKREDKIFDTKLTPRYDSNDERYRIGLYIRDSAAGIGTMTFFDPKSNKYGALGHVISDMDTKKPIEIHKGTIVRSNVTSIQRGSNGVPGEKHAEFSANDNSIGSITRNSPFGIFGELDKKITNGLMDEGLPIALSHQVKEGPAKILTVVNGQEVEEFEVEIVSTVPQKFPATKGMIVKITDKKLLKATGGIVQGMSGSPIIQDGKLVGAVTHVFVNDPTSGYGVHIEWMLHEAGVNIYENDHKRAS